MLGSLQKAPSRWLLLSLEVHERDVGVLCLTSGVAVAPPSFEMAVYTLVGGSMHRRCRPDAKLIQFSKT